MTVSDLQQQQQVIYLLLNNSIDFPDVDIKMEILQIVVMYAFGRFLVVLGILICDVIIDYDTSKVLW